MSRTPGPWTARGGGHNCQPRERNRADMLDWSSGIDCVAPFRDDEVSGYDMQTQTLARAHGRTLAEAEANAAFIVKACNAHDDLVAALESAIPLLIRLGDFIANKEDRCEVILKARAALAKVQPTK